MFSHAYDFYFIDLNIIYQIFAKNIWYTSKILIVAYTLFYWLPTKIFPQEYTGEGMQKIIYNFIYMVAYVEIIVPFLIFIKIFSILLFIFIIILTKLAFLQWYYKKDTILLLNRIRISIMLYSLDILDNPKELKNKFWSFIKRKSLELQRSLTLYTLSQKILFFVVFFYIISILIARGIYSYSDPVSDTSQFIEWVDFLQKNMLYPINKTFGADFYGMSIMIFFINLFTNINQIILFSLYPVLLLIALYFTIYYIIKDFSDSKYVALFAVIIHGLVLMTPLANDILGKIVTTSNPMLVHWYGLNFYIPTTYSLQHSGFLNGYIPYMRYISGMAYEHASIFVFLNIYFLIKIFQTHLDRYLLLYSLTLMLVFTFHGGGAIILVIMSILVTINAIIFGKLNLHLLKKGLLGIFLASIVGNMWLLSMIRYGVPQRIGAAAPIIDKLLKTRNNTDTITTPNIEFISISQINNFHIMLFALLAFAFIFSFFTKKRFLNSSYIMIVIAIFITYFGTNLGFPLLTKQSRLAEYLLFGITLLFSFYYSYFFYKPISMLLKKYTKIIMLIISFILFTILSLTMPKWLNSNLFWKNLNEIEYTSIPDIILKINQQNRPFTWTVISYIQEYAKVKNIGYHINTQNFLLKYNPKDKYLRVPTSKVFIFIENFPNPYKGMNEWYYRWRGDIQNSLKSWIAIYNQTHKNISIYYKTKTVTVYEINNNDYLNYLKEKMKNEKK